MEHLRKSKGRVSESPLRDLVCVRQLSVDVYAIRLPCLFLQCVLRQGSGERSLDNTQGTEVLISALLLVSSVIWGKVFHPNRWKNGAALNKNREDHYR